MIVYRTAGAWGSGLGRDVLPAEVDGNFYDLDSRVGALESDPPLPAEIASIGVVGNQMTITMSNATLFGPYMLPQAAFNFTGSFQPNHAYKRYDFLIEIAIADGAAMFTMRASSRTPFFLPADLDGSTAGLLAAPAADMALPIHKDASEIGALNFTAGGTVGMFDFPNAQQFTSPNALRVLRPAAIDETAFDLSMLFAGTKGTL